MVARVPLAPEYTAHADNRHCSDRYAEAY